MLQSIKNISSSVQCKSLNVWSVYFYFLAKAIFPEGMGVYKIVMEIPKGCGVILVVKKWKFLGGGGGGLREIPVVGVWIFSGTTHCIRWEARWPHS